jgi:hypothetical protein
MDKERKLITHAWKALLFINLWSLNIMLYAMIYKYSNHHNSTPYVYSLTVLISFLYTILQICESCKLRFGCMHAQTSKFLYSLVDLIIFGESLSL